MKCYIIVVSLDHCYVGIKEGIIQACHGKLAPIKRLKAGDKVILYANKQSFGSSVPIRRFVAIGAVTEDEPYQYEMFPGFCPFRRNIIYDKHLREVSVYELMDKLSFTQSKSWGMRLRYGFFEIPMKDYDSILKNML